VNEKKKLFDTPRNIFNINGSNVQINKKNPDTVIKKKTYKIFMV